MTQWKSSDQFRQLMAMGDFYDPPKAIDSSLTIVDKTWFEEEKELTEQELAAVCWFNHINQ